MEKIKVLYKVDRNDAIMAGEDRFGDVIVDVCPSHLSTEQRTELTTCVVSNNGIILLYHGIPHAYPEDQDGLFPVAISNASDDAVTRILDARIAVRARMDERLKREAEEKKRIGDERDVFDRMVGENPDNFIGDDNSVTKELREFWSRWDSIYIPNTVALIMEMDRRKNAVEKSYRDSQKQKSTDAWMEILKVHGTDNEHLRYGSDYLSNDEKREVAMSALFYAFNAFPQYELLSFSDVEKVCTCNECYARFSSSAIGVCLSSSQFENVKELKSVVNDYNGVCYGIPLLIKGEVRSHNGYCNSCEERIVRNSFRVIIEWNGEKFMRDYAL